MRSRIVDKIPYDQEIIDVPHLLDDRKLIVKLRQKLLMLVRVTSYQPLMTEFVQVSPRIIPLRHVKMRQLGHSKFNLHIAAVRDLLCVVNRLCRIRKQRAHLLLRFHKILPALITHAVFVGQFFSGLQTE